MPIAACTRLVRPAATPAVVAPRPARRVTARAISATPAMPWMSTDCSAVAKGWSAKWAAMTASGASGAGADGATKRPSSQAETNQLPALAMRRSVRMSVLQGGHEAGVEGDQRDEHGGLCRAAPGGGGEARGAEDGDLQSGLDGGRGGRVRTDERA